MTTLTKTSRDKAKTSITQWSRARWIGTVEELEARAHLAQTWLDKNRPHWMDKPKVSGTYEPLSELPPDQGLGTVEIEFHFYTELEHGKHNHLGTASDDPKMVAMREMIDRLSNHLDLVTNERFSTWTTGAVYDC